MEEPLKVSEHRASHTRKHMDNNLFVNPESRNASHIKHIESAPTKPTYTSVQPAQQQKETITNIIGNASIMIN